MKMKRLLGHTVCMAAYQPPISYNLSLIDMSLALCPRSLAPFYIVTYCNKMGQDFLVIQYMYAYSINHC